MCFFMDLAYNQAIDAWRRNEVPVGAVVAHEGEAIAAAHNLVETTNDPTAHAEMLAVTQATKALGDWRLSGATLYVTKEPCLMCTGAALLARFHRVVFAIADPRMGALGGATNLNLMAEFNHHLTVTSGVQEVVCRELIQSFFAKIREIKGTKVDESSHPSINGEIHSH